MRARRIGERKLAPDNRIQRAIGESGHQRGVNDYTPLHLAAAMNDANLVRILLSHGADTNARTRIDDFTTPLEEAEKRSSLDAVKILRETKERR